MAFPIDKKLVVGLSSNALFNLQKEDKIYSENGIAAYRVYQKENKLTLERKGYWYSIFFFHLNGSKFYPDNCINRL